MANNVESIIEITGSREATMNILAEHLVMNPDTGRMELSVDTFMDRKALMILKKDADADPLSSRSKPDPEATFNTALTGQPNLRELRLANASTAYDGEMAYEELDWPGFIGFTLITPWSFPEEALNQIIRNFPEIQIGATFQDMQGNFHGEYRNGKATYMEGPPPENEEDDPSLRQPPVKTPATPAKP